jgi:hypothetical protein
MARVTRPLTTDEIWASPGGQELLKIAEAWLPTFRAQQKLRAFSQQQGGVPPAPDTLRLVVERQKSLGLR